MWKPFDKPLNPKAWGWRAASLHQDVFNAILKEEKALAKLEPPPPPADPWDEEEEGDWR